MGLGHAPDRYIVPRPPFNSANELVDPFLLTQQTNRVKNKGLRFIQILHDNTQVDALLDISSTVSLAGDKLSQMFPELRKNLIQHKSNAISVDLSDVPFLGKMTFRFSLHKQEFAITAKYLENMPYPI